MNANAIGIATLISLVFIVLVYWRTGFLNITRCYRMWLTRDYWTSYNTVEFFSWLAKAVIIVPGLVFGLQIWWLYWFTLATSLSLIWASNRKLLPTLVGFNTIWSWISCMVLVNHYMG